MQISQVSTSFSIQFSFQLYIFFNFNYCDSCQTTAVIKTLTFNHRYSWVRRSVLHEFTNLLRLNHAQIQGCMFFRKCYYFCFRFAGFGNETWEGTSHQRFSSCKVSSSKSDFSFFVLNTFLKVMCFGII